MELVGYGRYMVAGVAPSWVLAVAGAISLAVAGRSLWTRPDPGGRSLVALASGTAVWAFARGLAGTQFGPATVWTRVAYLGVVLVAASWLVFALEYSGRRAAVTHRLLAALAVEPVVVTALVWTNDVHHLFWSTLRADPTTAGGVVTAFGVAYWLHAAYSAVLVVAGVYFMGRVVTRGTEPARGQAAAIAVAAFAPGVGRAALAFGASPVNLAPAGFAVSVLALYLATTRFDLVDVTPVARTSVVDDVDDGVVVVDDQHRVVDLNDTARELFDVGDRSVIGADATEAFGAYPEFYDRYADVTERQETVGLRTDGGLRYFDVQVAPLYDARDREAGRLFLLHDVTEATRRQRELERQNEQLDQFASLVSHDIRNPLNVADGYVDTVLETGDLSYLDEVERSHERMSQLIEDVLTLTREGQTVTETRVVDLARLARESWGNVATDDATLSVDVDRQVRGDPGRLRRVFENLFRNAIQHGGDSVTVRVGGLPATDGDLDDPASWGFFVEDDGVGIPEDEREAAFEDGFTTAQDGTGLGLSIVESVVEAHGWTVRLAESEEGGARFEVTGVDDPDPDGTGAERDA